MTWWNRKRPDDEIIADPGAVIGGYVFPPPATIKPVLETNTGDVVPYVDVMKETAPGPPEPDLSTKPEDILWDTVSVMSARRSMSTKPSRTSL